MRRTDLEAKIPDFIALAEERIGKELRTWRLSSIESLSASAGSAEVTLPARCREVEWVNITGTNARGLECYPKETALSMYAATDNGIPIGYYLSGDALYLVPTPASDYTLSAGCILGVQPLTTGNPTNSILTNYPGLYLHGALVEGYRHTRSPERMVESETAYQQALVLANREEIKRRSSGIAARRRGTHARRIP